MSDEFAARRRDVTRATIDAACEVVSAALEWSKIPPDDHGLSRARHLLEDALVSLILAAGACEIPIPTTPAPAPSDGPPTDPCTPHGRTASQQMRAVEAEIVGAPPKDGAA